MVAKNGKAELYCDSSSVGLAVVLRIGGVVVEDAIWLRQEDDKYHINISELDSVLCRLNLISKSELNEIVVYSEARVR